MSDAEVYVPKERVNARMVRKPEDVVTTSGRVQVPRYSYVVERERRDDFGNPTTVVEIYSNDEFNEAFAKLDWRAEDRQAAYDEGYAAAKAEHEASDDYERGWADAVKYHDITDNGPVSEGPQVAATPEQAEQAPAPVGDKLETDGPVSKREDSTDAGSTSPNVSDNVSDTGRTVSA